MIWEYVNNGGEATVYKASLLKLKALPYDLKFNKETIVAKRETRLNKEGNKELWQKNLIMQAIDEFFVNSRTYSQHHIPKPLGYFEKGHYYEFVKGNDNFLWETRSPETIEIFELDEWSIFVSLFNKAGFKVENDITDVDSCSSISAKNIVHDYSFKDKEKNILSKNWKRIDLGSQSLPWNTEIAEKFLRRNNIKLQR